MTESAIAATDMVEAVLDWKAFLESYPPESTVGVGNVVTTRGMYREASTPPIQLHCESSDCSGVHWFDHLEGDVTLVVKEWRKGRLIEEIGRVARRLGAKPEVLATFEAATNETQFSKAIDVIKDAIPESLLIDGHNPLKLLHTALSKGLHDDMKDDEACLEIAQSIRLVLTELAERISTALKDQAELTDALNRILKNNSEK